MLLYSIIKRRSNVILDITNLMFFFLRMFNTFIMISRVLQKQENDFIVLLFIYLKIL